MTRAASASAKPAGDRAPSQVAAGYLRRSEQPLASAVFVLPLIVLYELGTRYWGGGASGQVGQQVIAVDKMRKIFSWFGATGQFMPAFCVVGILLAWHLARRDAWRVSGMTCLGMLVESCFVAIPLLAMSAAMSIYLPMRAVQTQTNSISLVLGAGVYEEFVFRLAGMTILHLILSDWLKLTPKWSVPLMVLTSSAAFSLYHYWGNEAFAWRSFTIRTVAGIYFSVVFLCRGFGVTAGSHAAYDVMVILWRSAAASV